MRGRIPGRIQRGLSVLIVSAAAMLGGSSLSSAESINEALANAYISNPTLKAERARQRATDEQVPQALSGWRPTITGQGDASVRTFDEDNGILGTDNNPRTTVPGALSINLRQPVFRGFKTVESTRQAESTVKAGRQNLLAVEQQILFQAAQAYMNVLRDREIVAFQARNVAALREQLNGANERFKVGEVTKTDVAQAQARLSRSQADLAVARASLAASSATYHKVIGHKPGKVTYPRLVRLPKTLDSALVIAARTNPNILSASFVADAARHAIKVAFGDLLPTVSLNLDAKASATDLSGGEDFHDFDSSISKYQQEYSISGTIRVPLYEAGSVYSEVRRTKQVASQRQIQILESARAVRESVTSSWNFVTESQAQILASRAEVSASNLALDGVKQEALVGSRTTLDVLDAEQEVTDARITLAQAERDLIVAAYQLLGSMGTLTARDLRLNVEYYDPEENYLRVRNKWFGTDADIIE